MRSNSFKVVLVATAVSLVSFLFHTAPGVADDVTARIDVSLKAGRNVGVGYNLLPLATTRLEASLIAPSGYRMISGKAVDPDGELVWKRVEGEEVKTRHTMYVDGFNIERVNAGYGVRFEGELVRLATVPSDWGHLIPKFNASVAYLDIDVDAMNDHQREHWAPRPGNCNEEDQGEATIDGGLELPQLYVGALPNNLPIDADHKLLRLTSARVKWGGHPDGTPDPDHVGKVTFDISGPGLALYHLDGAKTRIVSGEEAIEVPPGGLSNMNFGILTNDQFTIPAAVTARYVWRSGLEGNAAYRTAVDWVRIRPAGHVSLTIDDVPDTQKTAPGAVVIKNDGTNDPPRKKVWLHSTATTGDVILTRSNAKVDVFTTATGGTPLMFDGTDNRFPVGPSDMPLALFVQGTNPSETMGDVTLTLSDEGSPPHTDSVTFTVLWVTISMRHEGTVSDDNAAKALFEKITVPGSDSLGYTLTLSTETWGMYGDGAFLARASEFVGHVFPSDFDLESFSSTTATIRMNRILDGAKYWAGPTGREQSREYPEAGDLSLYTRDDDPTDGGKIFDIDAPGLDAFQLLQFARIRARVNYDAFADFNDGTGWVRCSALDAWHSCQSYKKNADKPEHTGKTAAPDDEEDDWKIFLPDAYPEDHWQDGAVLLVSPAGVVQVRSIAASFGKTLTVWPRLAQPSRTGWHVTVIASDTWQQDEEYNAAGDNKNAEGYTPLSFDLQ